MKTQFRLIFLFQFLICSALFCAEVPANPKETNSATTEVVAPIMPSEDAESKKEKSFSIDEWQETSKKQEDVEDSHFSSLFSRMIGMLVVTVLLAVVAGWAAKRFLTSKMQQTNRTSRIQILEKRMLSPKSCVYLIQVDDAQLVIGESGHGISILKDIKEEKTDE